MKASKRGKGENSLRKTGRTNFPDTGNQLSLLYSFRGCVSSRHYVIS